MIDEKSQLIDTLTEAAHDLIRKGFSVFPVVLTHDATKGKWEKKPLVPQWKPYASRRAYPEEVQSWRHSWRRVEHPGLALVTGTLSGVDALDFDYRNGCTEETEKRLTDGLITVTQKTISGGKHVLVKHTAGVGNSAGIEPGVDVRGEGGWIVIAPTPGYEWTMSPEFVPVAGPNEAMRALFGKRKKGPRHFEAERQFEQGTRDEDIFTATLLDISIKNLTHGVDENTLEAMIQAAMDSCRPPYNEKPARAFIDSARRHLAKDPTEFLTDVGNAERLAERFGDGMKFCHTQNRWYVWTGQKWAPDTTGAVQRKAVNTVRAMYAEAAEISDDEKRKNLLKHAQRSEHNSRIRAMIEQARAMCPIEASEFDRDRYKLNVLNGTIDLKTGKLHPHKRKDFITKLAPVEYPENWHEYQAGRWHEVCPTWIYFLHSIFEGDGSMIVNLKRAVGYSLTGDAREEVMFILHGTGQNGKSTLLEAIRTMLGDYARSSPIATFLAKREENSARNDLARLRGARFITAIEPGEGKKIDDTVIKQMTGRDTITARFLYQEHEEFLPEGKIWLAVNHKPAIPGTEHATWRRLRLLPFTYTVPEEKKIPDLGERLKAEMPWILAWAVSGCLLWQEEGLRFSEKVLAATAEYRAEEDPVARFIESKCVTGPGREVQSSVLHKAYTAWAAEEGERGCNANRFSRIMEEKGFKRQKKNKFNIFAGIDIETETPF